LERRYRRTLRLLPAGYRQVWEEDMVNAYMDSASHHGGDANSGRSWAEHLSVLGLALRLRLSGAHASPRGLALRGAVHGFALVALLYMALGGVLSVARLAAWGFAPWFLTRSAYLLYWSGAVVPTTLWVAAFVTLVLGRATAARLLVLLAFLAQVGVMTVHIVLEHRPLLQLGVPTGYINTVWRQAVELSVANGVWLAIVTAATLVATEARPGTRRSFWLGGGALLAFVLVAPLLVEVAGYPMPFEGYLSLDTAVHFGLFGAMVAAVAVRRNPRWLLALALFVVVFAGNELLDYVRTILDARSAGLPFIEPLSYWQLFDFVLVALAVACAVVGIIGVRRLPRVRRSAAQP
jgi:hypothetical protein